METYSDNFKEFQILKGYTRQTGVSIPILQRFKDKDFRSHLINLHSNGSPLSEITEYIASFYSLEMTPQQLRKVLQKVNGEVWKTANNDYRQHRAVKQQERALTALGK